MYHLYKRYVTGEGLWLGLLHCYVMRRGKALEIQEADSHLRGPCPELWVQLLWLLFGTSKHVDGAQLVWGAPRQHRGSAEPQGIAVVLTHKPPSCQPRTDPERKLALRDSGICLHQQCQTKGVLARPSLLLHA